MNRSFYLVSLVLIFLFNTRFIEKKYPQFKETITYPDISDTTKIFIEKDESGKHWIDIISDSKENLLYVRTGFSKEVLSIAGFSNIDISRNDAGQIRLERYDFDNDGIDEFILTTYVVGSTYGASVYFIIYKDAWGTYDIYKLPFNRVSIIQEKNSNNYIISRYLPAGNIINYRFSFGILTPI